LTCSGHQQNSVAEHLDARQRNNLTVSNALAVVIAPTGQRKRAFVFVQLYHEWSQDAERSHATLVRFGAFIKIVHADRATEGDVR
jgi:hypothetical protein